MIEQKILPNARYGSWGYFLLVIGLAGISAFVLFINQDSLNSIGISTQRIWTVWGGIFAVLLLGLIGSPVWWRWKQKRSQVVYKPQVPGENIGPISVEGRDRVQSFSGLKKHLRRRHNFFWRHKVRLLLVTGDEAAIEQLIPGLQQQQWLEGNLTVLIYGGSLTAEPDKGKYTALRKLRHGRPLDGIVRIMPQFFNLTPQVSDNDLRGLEKISELLRYSAPVWLWQLCDSKWPQDGRTEQAVGASFPPRAKEDDIIHQLEQLLPVLRAQGVSQVTEKNGHDFLLRLGQHLKVGGIARWAQQLAPWLYASQQRIFLRGLMFSLPEAKPALDSVHPHALSDSALWQSIASDRARGRRTGLPWEQTLAWSLMSLTLLAGAGMLASSLFNRHQIVSAAEKAQVLVNSTKVDDAQLIALHGLRNDLGQQQHWLEHGAPWYQRFGINHTQQLHDALLPWYGVAAQRLIHEPARIALEEQLTYLAGLPAASSLRATLAQPGYKQLKAWLMMARPERAEPAFYAQTMATVQPEYPGISTSLWQTLAPNLWAFYAASLPSQPGWRIKPDASLLSQARQVLLLQTGQRNAEMTLYQNVLRDVRRNYTDLTLEDMTPGTDMRRLFSSEDKVPGVFTRQAWEGGVRQEIEKAANTRRDEIDWVLSDSWIAQKVMGDVRLTESDAPFAGPGNDILSLESEAAEKAEAESVEAALAWLQMRPGTSNTKDQWLLRLLMARVCEQFGKSEMALHLLDELNQQAGALTLAQWEPTLLFEVRARRLKLLRARAARSERERSRIQPEMDALLSGLITLDPVRAAILCS